MSHVNLNSAAQALPDFWKSTILAQLGNSNIKILKMDDGEYPGELHDYDEALIVISGKMNLIVSGHPIEVSEGEIYIVPAGTAHAVAKGSYGTLMLIDPLEK